MSKSKSTKKVPKKTIHNACCVYDFTLFDDIGTMEVRQSLKDLCKKYCFQLEKGAESGTLHYQGRFSLKIKKRQTELIKLLNDKNWKKFHISVTSNENKGNNFYVSKEETRVDGPFTDENDIYIPRDIRQINELRPWQNSLRSMLKEYDERTVDIVFDKNGNIGKSTLVRYMMLYDDAELLPFCNDYKDIMRMAYDIGPKKTYLIDMPRAINKEKLFQFFSGIETLKSGYCYDDRYKFTRRLFDRPRICVFTNVEPDKSLLSKDMWKTWCVEDSLLLPFPNNKHIRELDTEAVIVDDDSELATMEINFIDSDDESSVNENNDIKNDIKIANDERINSDADIYDDSDSDFDLFTETESKSTKKALKKLSSKVNSSIKNRRKR